MAHAWNRIDLFIARLRLKKVLPHVRGDTILDVGCGTHSLFLKSLGTVKRRIGVDKYVETRKEDGIEFYRVNLEEDSFPLEDESVDTIVSLAVIEHIAHPHIMLREMRRVLKKDGRIILTTPTPRSKPLLETLARLHIISPEEIFDHKTYYSRRTLSEVLQENGLILENWSSFQFGMNQLAIIRKK